MKASRIVACAALAAGAALAVDLYRPTRTSLYDFDGREMGRLETQMWRDYYEKRPVALLAGLAESHRVQFGQSISRAWLTAYYAARAAFVFKEGKTRADYEKALPPLRTYYAATLPEGASVDRVARLELEWWILHRERAGAELDAALAALQGQIYRMPPDRFTRHAALRAQAMRLCDEGGDWGQIGALLEQSWTSLSEEINRTFRK